MPIFILLTWSKTKMRVLKVLVAKYVKSFKTWVVFAQNGPFQRFIMYYFKLMCWHAVGLREFICIYFCDIFCFNSFKSAYELVTKAMIHCLLYPSMVKQVTLKKSGMKYKLGPNRCIGLQILLADIGLLQIYWNQYIHSLIMCWY